MQIIKNQILALMLLLLFFFAANSFAAETICVDESNPAEVKTIPDSLCKFVRIYDGRLAELYKVPDGKDARDKRNAVKGATFYVYYPKAQTTKLDTLSLTFKSDGSKVTYLNKVQLAENDSTVFLSVRSHRKLYNFNLGISLDDQASDPKVMFVYNFYVPYLKYYVDGKEVTDFTKLQYQVGESVKVDVKAYVPVGPSTDQIDTGLSRDFYFTSFGDNLVFEGVDGQKLNRTTSGMIVLKIENGEGHFVVRSTKAVGDADFSVSAYDDGKDSAGNIEYVVNEPFPGKLVFVNPDLPTLDKAAIYDTDGDGVGDSIAAWFVGSMDSVTVKNFDYSWPTDSNFKTYSGSVTNKGNVFGLPDVEVKVQQDSATGALKAFVCTTVGDRCDTLKTSLQDSIGAAIQSATLLKGKKDSKYDTLVVRFNKDMDTSWTKGYGFLLNGIPLNVDSAVSKQGNLWTFVVDTGKVNAGDSLKISVDCKASDCPDGILTAADGVPTDANNREVPVINGGRYLVNEDLNGFYDRNGDGRMDSASVGFLTPVTEESLKDLEIKFYWLDDDGDLLVITPNLSDLEISQDGHLVGFALDPEKYNVKQKLTGIDKAYSKNGAVEYGYVSVGSKLSVDDKSTIEETPYEMHDYMAPVISGTFLNPESFQMMEPDKFVITFSEAIDYQDLATLDDCLSFYVDGSWTHYSLGVAEWSDDGRTVTLYMEAGQDLATRMNPADSVRFDNFMNGLADRSGNKVTENAPSAMVEGDPRVIMKTNSFADLNKAAELSDHVKPFTIDHVKDAKEASDESSLGVLMDVGFSTIMKKDSTGAAIPNMDGIGLTWELYVYTNLGAYVGRASGRIACDDPFFDGNCLESPDKLYVRWNMRADNGRRVGVGIYLAKFKINVHGAQEDFKVERIFRWGVSAKRR